MPVSALNEGDRSRSVAESGWYREGQKPSPLAGAGLFYLDSFVLVERLLNNRTYAIAFSAGGLEGRRPSDGLILWPGVAARRYTWPTGEDFGDAGCPLGASPNPTHRKTVTQKDTTCKHYVAQYAS